MGAAPSSRRIAPMAGLDKRGQPELASRWSRRRRKRTKVRRSPKAAGPCGEGELLRKSAAAQRWNPARPSLFSASHGRYRTCAGAWQEAVLCPSFDGAAANGSAAIHARWRQVLLSTPPLRFLKTTSSLASPFFFLLTPLLFLVDALPTADLTKRNDKTKAKSTPAPSRRQSRFLSVIPARSTLLLVVTG